jgi:hypothetical protein
MKGHPHSIVGIFLLSVLLVINSPAVITVNGIADQEIENDQASFPVPSEAGFTIVAQLNGTPVVLDANPVISIPGNYEPGVSKRNDSDASEESIAIQLIVLDRSRGTSERGLINWIPSPTIDLAPQAFVGMGMQVVTPSALPLGFEIPHMVRLFDPGSGRGLRLNGRVEVPGVTSPLLLSPGESAPRKFFPLAR